MNIYIFNKLLITKIMINNGIYMYFICELKKYIPLYCHDENMESIIYIFSCLFSLVSLNEKIVSIKLTWFPKNNGKITASRFVCMCFYWTKFSHAFELLSKWNCISTNFCSPIEGNSCCFSYLT